MPSGSSPFSSATAARTPSATSWVAAVGCFTMRRLTSSWDPSMGPTLRAVSPLAIPWPSAPAPGSCSAFVGRAAGVVSPLAIPWAFAPSIERSRVLPLASGSWRWSLPASGSCSALAGCAFELVSSLAMPWGSASAPGAWAPTAWRARPRRKAGASRISATSPRVTMPLAAWRGRRRTSSGVAARLPTDMYQPLSWISSTPAARSWWLSSRALITRSRLTPRLRTFSGIRVICRERSWPPRRSTRATPGTDWRRGASTWSA